MNVYQRKKGRRFAVIKYTIAVKFKSVEHLERFNENQRQELKGEYYLNDSDTVYFEPADGIIVEKEQTISWARFGEKFWQFEDDEVGWKPTVDDKKSVRI